VEGITPEVPAEPHVQTIKVPSVLDSFPDDLPEVLAPPPTYKLHAPSDATLATFLGGPWAGAFVLALNYRAMGKRGAALMTLGLGTAGLAILLAFIMKLPGSSPASFFYVSLPGLLLMHVLAKGLQGRAYEEHFRRGGEKASSVAAAGIGVLTIGVNVLVGFAIVFFLEKDMGKRLAFGGGAEVFFKDVPEVQAQRLGHHLRTVGYFDGTHAVTVAVKKQRERVVVSFVLQPGAWNNADAVAAFREERGILSREVFDGQEVEIQLCDEEMKAKKTIP
jgi:hypothetical protein